MMTARWGTSSSTSTTWPRRFRTTRSAMKSTSARRSRKYSSGISSKRCLIFRVTRRTAHSALICSAEMSLFTSSTSIGSRSMSRCASRMSAWSLPSLCSSRDFTSISWCSERSMAVLNRSSSRSTSWPPSFIFGVRTRRRSSTNARPTAMPGLAPMAWSFRLIAWMLTVPPSLGLPEAVGDELADLPDAVRRPGPHRRDDQHLPLGSRQHQDPHDGLPVDLFGVGLESDVALAGVRELNQLGCCPSVQAQLVDDGELGFRALRRHHLSPCILQPGPEAPCEQRRHGGEDGGGNLPGDQNVTERPQGETTSREQPPPDAPLLRPERKGQVGRCRTRARRRHRPETRPSGRETGLGDG